MKREVAKLIDALKEAQELVIYVEGRDYHPGEFSDHIWEDFKMMDRYGDRRPELLEVAKQMIDRAYNTFKEEL